MYIHTDYMYSGTLTGVIKTNKNNPITNSDICYNRLDQMIKEYPIYNPYVIEKVKSYQALKR